MVDEPRNPFLISAPPGLLPPAPAAPPEPEPEPAPMQTTSTVPLPARGGPQGFATPPAAAVFGGALGERTSPSAARWRLALPDGRDVPIAGAAYLGRAPAAAASDRTDALLIAVQDEQRSVSKTHALLVVEGETVQVHDLGSTNGTWVIAPDGSERQALPGSPVPAVAGGRIELGALSIGLRLG